MKLATIPALAALLATPAAAAEPVNMLTITGTCETLMASYEDLSGSCGDKLLQIVYDDGRAGLYITGRNFILTFSGTSDEVVGDEIHQDLDKVLIGTDADNVNEIRVKGTCTFGNPYTGPADIACNATTKDGTVYTFEFTTDGQPPVDEMAE